MDNDNDSNTNNNNGGKKQRTIQVKIGGQATKSMTPDQAAEYLKTIAGKGAFAGGREVKMTFNNNSTATATVGPPRKDGDKRNASSAAAAAAAARKDGMPCSEKEMKALMSMFVEIMGLQMNTDKLNKPRQSRNHAGCKSELFQFPQDLPPPPGGWPEDLMWPMKDDHEHVHVEGGTGDNGNDTGSISSLPDLEDVVSGGGRKNGARNHATPPTTRSAPPNLNGASNPYAAGTAATPPAPVTGVQGIAAFEWEALERVAIEDALEQEERARKATRKRDSSKKARKKEKARKEAQLKAQEALSKKQSKAIASWKSRVVAAVQSNQVTRLETVLQESPLKTNTGGKDEASSTASAPVDATVRQHMDYLAPHAVPKNRQSVNKGKETRLALVQHICASSPDSLVEPLLRNGRSVLHVACFFADIDMIQTILSYCKTNLDTHCQDSGWTPLHYAALCGSIRALELLTGLVNVKAVTNDTHTWRVGNGKGITPKQLLDFVMAGTDEKELETHGMALAEAKKDLFGNTNAAERAEYMTMLEAVQERFCNLEAHGYTLYSESKIAADENRASQAAQAIIAKEREAQLAAELAAQPPPQQSQGKKNKKKKSQQSKNPPVPAPAANESADARLSEEQDESVTQDGSATNKTTASGESASTKQEEQQQDPLITALYSMGFTEDQIMPGIAACGGLSRATADDVVAWIFGGQQDQPSRTSASSESTMEEKKPAAKANGKNNAAARSNSTNNANAAAASASVEAKRQEALKKAQEERLAAERLAAKREEQRRRNREWNNRAQKRQLQEAQAKMSKATATTTTAETTTRHHHHHNARGGGIPTAMGPGANYLLPAGAALKNLSTAGPTLGGPKPGVTIYKNPAPSAPPANSEVPVSVVGPYYEQQHQRSPAPPPQMNDGASTIASSLENVSVVDVCNDDATISTLGSFPATTRTTPVPGQQQIAPPGFSSMMQQQQQQQPPDSYEELRNRGVFVNSVVPPPGIPESKPLSLDPGISGYHHHHHFGAADTSRLGVGGGDDGLGGAGFGDAGVSSLLSGAASAPIPPNLGLSASMEPSGLFSSQAGTFLGIPAPPGPATVRAASEGFATTSSLPGTSIYGLGGDPSGQAKPPLDSSALIDSISTGNGALPSASGLWGENPTTATGGSSLLGNLISQQSGGGSDLFGNAPESSDNWGQPLGTSFHRSRSGSIW